MDEGQFHSIVLLLKICAELESECTQLGRLRKRKLR